MSTLAWQILTVSALNDAKAAPLIAAVQNTCLATGQADPTTNLIANIVEELRGAIGYSGKYQVSATTGSLPPNLVDMAVQKIVRVCKRRLEQPLSPDEQDEERQYQQRVAKIIAGQWPIDLPTDPMTSAPSNPLGRVSELNPMNVGMPVVANRPFARNQTAFL